MQLSLLICLKRNLNAAMLTGDTHYITACRSYGQHCLNDILSIINVDYELYLFIVFTELFKVIYLSLYNT